MIALPPQIKDEALSAIETALKRCNLLSFIPAYGYEFEARRMICPEQWLTDIQSVCVYEHRVHTGVLRVGGITRHRWSRGLGEFFLFTSFITSHHSTYNEWLSFSTLHGALLRRVQDAENVMKRARNTFERGGIKEELMAKVWHPRNLAKFKDWGDDTYDMHIYTLTA